MLPSAHLSRVFRIIASGALLAVFALAISAQTPPATTQNQTAPADKPKIRAITFFVNIDRAEYQTQIADACKSLRFARTIFESRGYVVQNLQIATQPFPEYTRDLPAGQALEFFRKLDALAADRRTTDGLLYAMVRG